MKHIFKKLSQNGNNIKVKRLIRPIEIGQQGGMLIKSCEPFRPIRLGRLYLNK